VLDVGWKVGEGIAIDVSGNPFVVEQRLGAVRSARREVFLFKVIVRATRQVGRLETMLTHQIQHVARTEEHIVQIDHLVNRGTAVVQFVEGPERAVPEVRKELDAILRLSSLMR
jgi:hypothetical protein